MVGWWKTAISHLKHSYLNWRAIPYRRKMICVYAVFFIIFSTFFFNFLDFRLDLIDFSSAWHRNQFFFFFYSFVFFFFFNGLLWATSHVIDGLPAWIISSYMRIVLKGLAFGSKLLVSFLSRGKVWLKSILEKWAILVNVPWGIDQGDFKKSRSWDLCFLVIEKAWKVWSCSKSWCIPNY